MARRPPSRSSRCTRRSTGSARSIPRGARIVEARVFGGMTVEEVAHVLGVSTRTVELDWTVARRWLARELKGPRDGC